jgi:glycosyltransferase involved in cell wall biosynthesis
MRVQHMHKIAGVSGSERHLLSLLPALRSRGVDARMLALHVGEPDAQRFYAELDDADVPYRRVRCTADVNPRMALEIVRAVRAEQPDLLHTHLVHADIYGSIASALTGVPFVSSRHNDDRYLLGPFRHVDRAFARRARRLVAISDAVREFLARAGLPRERLVTIHYGLDELPSARSEVTPTDAAVPEGAPLALAVGRLIQQKDHAVLLRAFARARAQLPQAMLAILGSGPLEGELRALRRELGLEGAVVLPGRLEIRDWLERADVFVHTSRWEGFGIVLLEAMLARLPIVATRVSAVPEVVAAGETGLLTDPGDVAGIADALAALLGDPPTARTFGEAGRARARARFSVGRMTDRTLDVYRGVLASG